MVQFRILGPVEVRRSADRITINGSKLHTVLTALLLSEGRVVADSQLSMLLWGWDPPATAGAQIYSYISRLRKCLAPEVEIERRQPGYVLHLGREELDYHYFMQLSHRGRGELDGRLYQRAANTFREALALWRGPALSTVTEFMVDLEQPRLQEAWLAALEARVEADQAVGRHRELLAELFQLVHEHPVHEPFRVHLMIALYRCDRRADAIAAYHEGRRILSEELGIDAGQAMRSAFQTILEGRLSPRPGLVASEPPALPSVEEAMRSMLGRSMLAEEVLGSLVAAKLIQPTRHGADGQVRYELRGRAALAAGSG